MLITSAAACLLPAHLPNRLTPSLNLHKARGRTGKQNSHGAQMKRQTAAQAGPLVRTKEDAPKAHPSFISKKINKQNPTRQLRGLSRTISSATQLVAFGVRSEGGSLALTSVAAEITPREPRPAANPSLEPRSRNQAPIQGNLLFVELKYIPMCP